MESYEQIAQTMHAEYRTVYISQGQQLPEWDLLSHTSKNAWIAAAKVAHEAITGTSSDLTDMERSELFEILASRANEVARFCASSKERQFLGSVELALTREIKRLRQLAHRVNPMQEVLHKRFTNGKPTTRSATRSRRS